jgi:hypothetical protein
MVISLLVLLVPVFVLVGGYQLLTGRTEPVAVDPAGAVEQARAAGLEVTAPGRPPPGWTPVSAVFQQPDGGATLRIGYATPDGGSAQLVQSTVPAETLLPGELHEAGAATGTVEVGGRSWQRYETRPGERALVWLRPELTTIVIGTAAESELRALAVAVPAG